MSILKSATFEVAGFVFRGKERKKKYETRLNAASRPVPASEMIK